MDKEFYGITDVSKLLQVTRTTILRYANAGIVRFSVGDGGRKLFHRDEIAALRRKMYDLRNDEAISIRSRRYNLLWRGGGIRRLGSHI
jgi:DNA-binding transcriptional MerR regulator